MAWLEISLDIPRGADPDAWEQALLGAGAASVTLSDAGDDPVLEPGPGETPLWPMVRVTGMFMSQTEPALVAHHLQQVLDLDRAPALHTNPLEDRDWTRAWMDNFAPMRFGERLWVVPEGFALAAGDAINLRLDPGLAFGTGTHPTTALCLEWLDRNPPRDAAVIDYGCGSGILAIAALLLGARTVQAVDNDPQALLATLDNAHKNNVAANIQILAPEQLGARSCDVLLANILAGPLLDLEPRFAALTKPSGRLVLSGLLAEQVPALQQRYSADFELSPPQLRDGWARLDGVRRSDKV